MSTLFILPAVVVTINTGLRHTVDFTAVFLQITSVCIQFDPHFVKKNLIFFGLNINRYNSDTQPAI